MKALTGIAAAEFARRRRQLMRMAGEDAILVLPAAPERVRSHASKSKRLCACASTSESGTRRSERPARRLLTSTSSPPGARRPT